MYKFLVHVERENLRNWPMSADGRTEFNAVNSGSRIQSQCDWSDIVEMETWYFNDKKTADTFAAMMSRKCPGKVVYTTQTVSYTQTPPGVTVTSDVSEKGVLPK